jgi:hypothetical protein
MGRRIELVRYRGFQGELLAFELGRPFAATARAQQT